MAVYGLPRSHYHCTFENFDWSGLEPKRTALLAYLRPNPPRRTILMTGPPGAGKSHLSVALWRWAVRATGDIRASAWVDLQRLCVDAKAWYGGGGDDPFLRIRDAKFMVCLDDVFGRDYSAHDVSQILHRAVHEVHANAARLVVTTNTPREEFSTMLRAHENSRILAGATWWEFPAAMEDRRLNP